MKPSPLQVCSVLSCLAMAAGALGMVASFIYMASRDMRDITAGTSGFVAGAVLIGSGLVSLTILATHPSPEKPSPTTTAELSRMNEGGWGITGDVRRPDPL
jgi:hypothetical protein